MKKRCFLTVTSLGCVAQSCLSVSVLNCCLVLFPPQMSLGMCKGGCECVCSSRGKSFPTFQISIRENKSITSTIRGMEGVLSSSSIFFKRVI